MIVMHKHHIVPRREGGSNDPSNLIICSIDVHAYLHRMRYLARGDEFDRIAADALSGLIGKDEALHRVAVESGKRAGSAGRGHTSWNKGGTISEAQKRKISATLKGKEWSEAHWASFREHLKTATGFTGKKHSPEARAKMSLKATGMGLRPVEVDGVVYPSRKAAAAFHNVASPTISRWVREGKAKEAVT